MGIFFGILSGVADSLKNLLAKKAALNFNSLTLSWGGAVFAALVLAPFIFIGGIPELDMTFWWALAVRTILEATAIILFYYSIKITDLSLCLPLLALTPLPLLIAGIVLNGEIPNYFGLAGVFLIVFGVYALNFKKGQNIFYPLVSTIKNRGSLAMLTVAVLWGITGALHKLAIQHSAALFYAGFSTLVLALALTAVILIFDRSEFLSFLNRSNLTKIAPIGFLEGLVIATQMLGQSMTLSVFAISAKRTSVLFSSLLGWRYLNEPIRDRILPILILCSGIFLLVLN